MIPWIQFMSRDFCTSNEINFIISILSIIPFLDDQSLAKTPGEGCQGSHGLAGEATAMGPGRTTHEKIKRLKCSSLFLKCWVYCKCNMCKHIHHVSRRSFWNVWDILPPVCTFCESGFTSRGLFIRTLAVVGRMLLESSQILGGGKLIYQRRSILI